MKSHGAWAGLSVRSPTQDVNSKHQAAARARRIINFELLNVNLRGAVARIPN
jgi:hypothetical protein